MGYTLDGYSVRIGVAPGTKDQGFSFTLRTPERSYNLSAATDDERDEWIKVIESVIERPLTSQDTIGKFIISSILSIFHDDALITIVIILTVVSCNNYTYY